MKKLFILITMGFLSMGAFAQGEIVTKYFNQFATDDNYVKVSVSSKMFSLFTELEAGSPEEKEFLAAVSKLKGIKMIIGDSVSGSLKTYNQALKDITAGGFEELMSVTEKDNNYRFSVKEKSGKIEELIMLAGGGNRFMMMSLYGEIDLKNISKIAKSMNVKGLSDLEKLNGTKSN